MIVKATKKDEKRLLDFANKAPAINLFIIGDIETYGFDNEFQEIWFEEIEGKIEGIYLKFRDNFIVYSERGKMNPKEVADLILANGINHINAIETSGDLVYPYLEEFFKRIPTYYCILDDKTHLSHDSNVVSPKEEDCELIASELAKITEFGMGEDECKAGIKRHFEQKSRQLFIKDEQGLISYANIAVESSSAGMVVSVFTSELARGKGYATKVVSALTYDLVQEGKTACLFYNNPNAGAIYHKIGYKDIENFIMYKRIKENKKEEINC